VLLYEACLTDWTDSQQQQANQVYVRRPAGGQAVEHVQEGAIVASGEQCCAKSQCMGRETAQNFISVQQTKNEDKA
jgi:hypothetical protein